MNTYREKFIDNVLKYSVNKDWEYSRLEWKVIKFSISDSYVKCICTHKIGKVCHVKNNMNGKVIKAGVCCVNKFFKINYGYIFNDIKKQKQCESNRLSKETLVFCCNYGYINEWEYNFYTNIYTRRSLTEKQMSKYIHINKKVLNYILTK